MKQYVPNLEFIFCKVKEHNVIKEEEEGFI